jgi:hypothetical protein
MYDYSEEAILLPPNTPSDIEIQLDNLRVTYPVVPRICARKAYFFIWFGNKETDADLYEDSQRSKYDSQWVHCQNKEHIEKGVVMVHIYDDEVIIGTMKTAGYMNRRSNIEVRSFIRKMWTDIILMFGEKKIICPSGTYLECLHLIMNQKRITHEPYHREIMKQFGFTRIGDYWVR